MNDILRCASFQQDTNLVPITLNIFFVQNHCFPFLLGVIQLSCLGTMCITLSSREIEDSVYAKFWEINKVHYGPCENGEYKRQS